MTRARSRVRTVLFSLVLVTAGAVGGLGVTAATTATNGTAPTNGAAAAAQEDVTLTVTVVDQSGNPLSDAQLSATWDGGGPVNATTAGNGKAFLDVTSGEDVTIAVDHRFYVRNQAFVVENASEGDVEIQVARKGQATVVVSDQNGRLGDAIVRMFHDGHAAVNARTNANGVLTTEDIERGEYTLVTFKEGYARNRTTVTVGGETRRTMSIQQETVLVTFRVSDDHFDPARSLSNANVTVPNIADVTTQGNGAVTVSIPVNEEYDVTVTKPEYRSVTRTLDVRESRTALNVSVQRTPGINATADNKRVVVGEPVRVTVRDEYGDAVPNASVSLDDSTAGETDDQGVISIPIETAGNHTIAATSGDLDTSIVVEGVEAAPDETPTGTAAPATATTTSASGSLGPGFGPVVSLVAILGLATLLARRRR